MEKKNSLRFDSAAGALCERIRKVVKQIPDDVKEQTQELRLRINRPVSVCCTGGIYFVTNRGGISCRPGNDMLMAEKEDLEESFHTICSYSIYSHQNEIRNGYVTLAGGHRVGISGTAVCKEGEITGMRDISSVNVRIAREIPGAADGIIECLHHNLSSGLLLAGAPASGKTTILRDIARQLSSGICGNIKKVTVVDERGELAGTYMGIPQNDLGVCSDVLDGYPKAQGILQAVRSLSPEYIICDELGTSDEVRAVEQGLNAGVSIISSIHAGSIEEFIRRRQAVALLETGAFGYVAILDGHEHPGTILGVYKAGDLLAEAYRRTDADCGGNARRYYGVA